MREASYLALNEQKWRKTEELLNQKGGLSSDQAVSLFNQLIDDLSYVKTHYPGSVTEKYLNHLSSQVYAQINQRDRYTRKQFKDFWMVEVPSAIAKHHGILLWVFVFFLMSVLIGVVSTHYDEQFPRYVMSDAYVDQTLENIEKGDPMAVYKSQGKEDMFWGITLNNLKVSGLIFISGILVCLGPFYILFKNAVMVGSFQYFFVKQDLFLESFLTIWMHGTIEISCLIIASFAGVVMGKGILFPGTYKRSLALINHAKDGVKIFMGIIPLVILAGFIESVFTRETEAPIVVRLLAIACSATFVIWYFVLLPRKISRVEN